MNSFQAKIFLVSAIIAGSLHAEKTTIDTGINTFQMLQELSLDDKLTILSVGKLKALVSQPEIAKKLQTLDMALDVAYHNAVAAAAAHGETVDELVFKQNIVLILYAVLYKMVEDEVAEHGTAEQKMMLNQQITPEEITNILTEK